CDPASPWPCRPRPDPPLQTRRPPRRPRHRPSRPHGVSPRMATDYDAPRKTEEDLSEDSIEELKARRSDKSSGVVDEDEAEAAEGFELPGADLSGEEL